MSLHHETLDRTYLMCHQLAAELLNAGEIRAFSVTHCRNRGRVITIETDQGWDPHPLHCDHWPDDEPARYL